MLSLAVDREELKMLLKEVLQEVLVEQGFIPQQSDEDLDGNTQVGGNVLSPKQAQLLDFLQHGVSINKASDKMGFSLTRGRQMRDTLERRGYSTKPVFEMIDAKVKANGWQFAYDPEGQIKRVYKIFCPKGNIITLTPDVIYDGKCPCHQCSPNY